MLQHKKHNTGLYLNCFLLAAFFLSGCYSHTPNPLIVTTEDSLAQLQFNNRAFDSIHDISYKIKTGDIVLRTGNDFTSEGLRSLNQRDQMYSHCGIASIENDSLFVYHALGGEFNPDQKLKRELLTGFAEPYSNRGIGVYRFDIEPEIIKNCVELAKKLFKEGTMFDLKFDLKSDDRMYCAEFVYKTFSRGSQDKLKFNISHIKAFSFIGVDDIFLQPNCHLITQVIYK